MNAASPDTIAYFYITVVLVGVYAVGFHVGQLFNCRLCDKCKEKLDG